MGSNVEREAYEMAKEHLAFDGMREYLLAYIRGVLRALKEDCDDRDCH